MLGPEDLLALARCLCEAPAGTCYLEAVRDVLLRHVGGDEVFWIGGDFASGAFAAWRASELRRDPSIEAVMPGFTNHPGVRSYIEQPADLAPRRMSGLPQVSNRRFAEALQVSRGLLGHDQLSILHSVHAGQSWSGHGWVVGRDVGTSMMGTSTPPPS